MFNMTNVTSQQHENYKDFYETSRMINGLILFPIICIPGLIGNTLTLIVLSMKNMKTSTNAFLAALAVSDSIKLINDLLYFSNLLLRKTDPASANIAFVSIYPYAHFIFNISTCVSSWLTVSVAMERFILVCYPIQAKTICTRFRAIIVSVVIYIVMISISLPCAFRYQKYKPFENSTDWNLRLTDLWENQSFTIPYTWILNILRSNIVLIILIILNACIVNSLRKIRANKKNTKRNRITIMMIVVIVVFVICILPDAIMSTFFRFGYHEEDNYLVKGVREFSDTLLTINAAVNFLIYCCFSQIFRQNFMTLFSVCGICKTPRDDKCSYQMVECKHVSSQSVL